jgi:6-phosphogluconolactonase
MKKLILILLSCLATASAADMFVFFGTHTTGPGKGFSLAHFDTATGALTTPVFLQEAADPAYFILHPDGRHLYTCNSILEYQGKPGGSLSAYAIDPATARLTLLNRQPSYGGDPSYVSFDRTLHFLFVANYQGGNIAAFALKPDGSLGERTAFIQHTGKSVDPKRQTKPYAHSIVTDPANRFVLVPDLGVDKMFIYRFDASSGALRPNDPPFVTVKPGAGPRHVVFHPNGHWVYLIHEMGSIVTLYDWDAARGALKEVQTVSTLPEGWKGVSTCSEMLIHPNGKFLYASNRGHDSIALFDIDAQTGRLKMVSTFPTLGKTPRNFAFDPTNRWLLVTNHESNNAVVFAMDEKTGRLTPHGQPVSVPYPFCERFLPVVKK